MVGDLPLRDANTHSTCFSAFLVLGTPHPAPQSWGGGCFLTPCTPVYSVQGPENPSLSSYHLFIVNCAKTHVTYKLYFKNNNLT